jgi:hypothetical protein
MSEQPKSGHSRRGFLAILGGAAAAFALRPVLPAEPDRPKSDWDPKKRWVGHF